MFNNFWKLIRQEDYICSLKQELEQVRSEKKDLQDTLHRVLRIHLIPNDLREMRESPPSEPVPIVRRNSMRSALNELQKRSYDKSIQEKIKETEAEIKLDGTDEF